MPSLNLSSPSLLRASIPHLFCSKGLLNNRLQVLRFLRASPTFHNLAIASNEELLEIPLHALQPHESGFLGLEPFEDGGCVVAIDLYCESSERGEAMCWSIGGDAYIDFTQHGEGDAVVHLAELLNLVIGARVLAAELVAGEAEDYEVRVCGLEVLFHVSTSALVLQSLLSCPRSRATELKRLGSQYKWGVRVLGGAGWRIRTWYNFSSPANWGVKPHFEAVLTTRTTLPLSCAREYS